jgi:predicted RNase H-like HicB family nuclease
VGIKLYRLDLQELALSDYNLRRRFPMVVELTAVSRKVREGYIGFVEELPSANTQGATLEKARRNLAEVVRMVLDANRGLAGKELKGQEVIREPLQITGG